MVELRTAQRDIARQQQQLQRSREQTTRQQEQVRKQQQQLQTRAARGRVTSLAARSSRRQQVGKLSGRSSAFQSSQQKISQSQKQLQTQERQVKKAIEQQDRQAAINKAIQNSLSGKKTNLSKFSAADRRQIQNISSELESSSRTQGIIGRQKANSPSRTKFQSEELQQTVAPIKDLQGGARQSFSKTSSKQSFFGSGTSQSFARNSDIFQQSKDFSGTLLPPPKSTTKKERKAQARRDIQAFVNKPADFSKEGRQKALAGFAEFEEVVASKTTKPLFKTAGKITGISRADVSTSVADLLLGGATVPGLPQLEKAFTKKTGIKNPVREKLEGFIQEEITSLEQKPVTSAILSIGATKVVGIAGKGLAKVAPKISKTTTVTGTVSGVNKGKVQEVVDGFLVKQFDLDTKLTLKKQGITQSKTEIVQEVGGKGRTFLVADYVSSKNVGKLKQNQLMGIAIQIDKAGKPVGLKSVAVGRGFSNAKEGITKFNVVAIDPKQNSAALVTFLERTEISKGIRGATGATITKTTSQARVASAKAIKLSVTKDIVDAFKSTIGFGSKKALKKTAEDRKLRAGIIKLRKKIDKNDFDSIDPEEFRKLFNIKATAEGKTPFSQAEWNRLIGEGVINTKTLSRTIISQKPIDVIFTGTKGSFGIGVGRRSRFGKTSTIIGISKFKGAPKVGTGKVMIKRIEQKTAFPHLKNQENFFNDLSVDRLFKNLEKGIARKKTASSVRSAPSVLKSTTFGKPSTGSKLIQTQKKKVKKAFDTSLTSPTAGRLAARVSIKSKSLIGPKIIAAAGISSFAKTRSKIDQKVITVPAETPATMTGTGTGITTTTGLATRTATGQASGLTTRTITTTSTGTGITRLTPPINKITFIPIVPLRGNSEQRKQTVKRDASGQGYKVFFKEKGKFKKVNKKPLKYSEALDLGSDVVDHTLANTFVIKKTRGKVKKPSFRIKRNYFVNTENKFRNFRIKKGKRILLKNKYIEKRGKARLDTLSERKKLTAAAYLARIRKRRIFKAVKK